MRRNANAIQIQINFFCHNQKVQMKVNIPEFQICCICPKLKKNDYTSSLFGCNCVELYFDLSSHFKHN